MKNYPIHSIEDSPTLSIVLRRKEVQEIFLLIIAHFIANFLFIRKYSFYSDDWSAIVVSPDAHTPYLTILLDAQRPLLYATNKFVSSLALDALTLQIAGFLLTTLLLILMYLIITKISSDFGFYQGTIPFLTCLLYIVLFNKDEIYPWLVVSTCNIVGYLLYALSIYCFLHRKRRFFLPISLIAYGLGLLTYEIGIALPLFFVAAEYLTRKKIKESFFFILPLIGVLAIRSTLWFGFGSLRLDREAASLDPVLLLLHTCLFIFTTVLIFTNQIQFSIIGWTQISVPVLVLVLFLDLLLISAIIKYLSGCPFPTVRTRSFTALLCIGLITFSVPYILTTGGTPTRGYVFIDLFIAGLLVLGLLYTGRSEWAKRGYLIIIIVCLLTCQGLYMNWVVAGEISDRVAESFCTHQDEILKKSYVYFNSTSFVQARPNSIRTAFHPTREDLFRLKNLFLGETFDGFITKIGKEDSPRRIDDGYVQYYNAKCLDRWALGGMMERCGVSNRSLIYGGNWYGFFPIEINKTSILYQEHQENLPTGTITWVNRSDVFEISADILTSRDQ
ncbi:MAG TPA: hypothetical protein VN372_07855 [Methanospirillum sp.]|nr:hypothetical protein [Methanospirillum sp.]